MPKQICFNYNRNGFCKFGSYCRFKHVNNNFNRDNVEFNSASFLGEIKSVVHSVKSLVEQNWQPPSHQTAPMPFAGYTSQQLQVPQQVGQGKFYPFCS